MSFSWSNGLSLVVAWLGSFGFSGTFPKLRSVRLSPRRRIFFCFGLVVWSSSESGAKPRCETPAMKLCKTFRGIIWFGCFVLFVL